MDCKTFNKWYMYHTVHQMSVIDGKKPSQIANWLGIDTRTVKKILSMDEKQYEAYLVKISSRRKRLLEYEDFVKRRIENCLEASAAQVHDWLKEAYPDFIKVSERTVYNFVRLVRSKYGLTKVFSSRQFSMVKELDYGKQAQIDFGEYNMTDTDGKRIKVYFYTMVLSRSRFKFVYFSTEPFTTDIAIQAMNHGFKYIDGCPDELVMDQDKLLLYRENYGDIILTDKFRDYSSGMPFRLHFCRKNDPQSKGKIENVIKYVKYNFLRGRTFYDLYTLNSQAIEWLERTANAKVHATTFKIPAEELKIEKASLQKPEVMCFLADNKMRHSVRIDNTISYKGSLYTLPLGTYKGNSTYVFTQEEADQLIICNEDSVEIVRHKISLIKGSQVRNNNHFRDNNLKIIDKISQVAQMFTSDKDAVEYLESIRNFKPRYIRDQLYIIEKACSKYQQEELDLTLKYCMENKIFNATDFEPVLLAVARLCDNKPPVLTVTSSISKYKIIPEKSNIEDYNQIIP
jgi:transposase